MSAKSELNRIEKDLKMDKDTGSAYVFPLQISFSDTDPYYVKDPESGELKEVSKEEYLALGGKIVNYLDIINGSKA